MVTKNKKFKKGFYRFTGQRADKIAHQIIEIWRI